MGQHRRTATAAPRGRRAGRSAAVTLAALATAGAGGIAAGVVPAPPGTPDGFVLSDGGPFSRGATGHHAMPELGGTGSPLHPTGAPAAGGRPAPSASAQPGRTPAPGRPSTAPSRSSAPSHSSRGSARPTVAPSRSPQPAPSASARPAPPLSAAAVAAKQVLTLVNAQRALHGCSPLQADGSLAALARAHSDDMAARNFFDHTNPSGQSPWDRAEQAGVTNLSAENIARGQADAKSVMESWMNSPGHRANILNCDYKTLGVGVHLGAGGPWWTQDFGW